MNMICRWVRADDGTLVMEWRAEDRAVHGGTGRNEEAYNLEMFDHRGRASSRGAA
jgi:hypothetical protein